jgi:Na+-transporting methylmalonyl-CoA/oxaloacetate decarboxylase gamma subunit
MWLDIGIIVGFLVFVFVAPKLAGKIMRAMGLDKTPETAARPNLPVHVNTVNNAEITAAIAAAVNEYRKLSQ